jgi:hypothetical protein
MVQQEPWHKLPSMLYAPWYCTGNIILGRLWVVQDMTRWGGKTGQRADWEKANCSSTLALTALTTMGTCNGRVCKLCLGGNK